MREGAWGWVVSEKRARLLDTVLEDFHSYSWNETHCLYRSQTISTMRKSHKFFTQIFCYLTHAGFQRFMRNRQLIFLESIFVRTIKLWAGNQLSCERHVFLANLPQFSQHWPQKRRRERRQQQLSIPDVTKNASKVNEAKGSLLRTVRKTNPQEEHRLDHNSNEHNKHILSTTTLSTSKGRTIVRTKNDQSESEKRQARLAQAELLACVLQV